MTYRSVFAGGLFDGRAVVVTGGGSGIGRCIAHELASLGASVALVGRTADTLASVADEIRTDGGTVTTHSTDIRDEDGVRAVVDEVLAAHGRIDGLVNNAGGQYRAPLAGMSTKGFEAVVRTNLTGGFIVMREVHDRWMARHGGAIVTIVSDFWGGWPGFGHSAAARAGMANLTETAATEWAAAGVRVNAVAPGPVASSGLDTYDEVDRDVLRGIAREVPLQRFGTESEVSAAVVFLLSPAASFVTGTCLRVDGGVPNARPGWWELPPAERGERFDGFHRSRTPDILDEFSLSVSIRIEATPQAVYDLVSDVTRTGEWSPICFGCTWHDGGGPRVGARFTGRNRKPDREWSTTGEVVAAEPGRAFAWEIHGMVRWGYEMQEQGSGTRLTETWDLSEAGRDFLRERYGATGDEEIAIRAADARSGIPATLAAIKRIAESTS